MRRASLLAVVGAVLLVAFAGVALAAAITCTGGPCFGTSEPDQITGSAQRDVIEARAGNDVVRARAGDDELHGDRGDDDLFGEVGNDVYFGDNGNDTLTEDAEDRKSTRLNSSHANISYAVFCLKKKKHMI